MFEWTLLQQIAEYGTFGLALALFVFLYLKERRAHNGAQKDFTKNFNALQEKRIKEALSMKDLFHKVIDTIKIIGDENSQDFQEFNHRLDKIEEKLNELADGE